MKQEKPCNKFKIFSKFFPSPYITQKSAKWLQTFFIFSIKLVKLRNPPFHRIQKDFLPFLLTITMEKGISGQKY